jgi:hypothetical protein
MAGRRHAIEVIDVSQLCSVTGGVDKQTQAAQLAITQATTALASLAKQLEPKDTGMMEMVFQLMSRRRSQSGPSSAPALPPTTTLTR